MNIKSTSWKKILFKLLGFIMVITGLTFITIGLVEFITAVLANASPRLFVYTFTGIPIFFIGAAFIIFSYMRKAQLTVTQETLTRDDSIVHKVAVGSTVFTDKKECRECGRINDADGLFCKYCGAKL